MARRIVVFNVSDDIGGKGQFESEHLITDEQFLNCSGKTGNVKTYTPKPRKPRVKPVADKSSPCPRVLQTLDENVVVVHNHNHFHFYNVQANTNMLIPIQMSGQENLQALPYNRPVLPYPWN
jgi:hypothetical protein